MSGHERSLSVNGMLRILLAVILSAGIHVWAERSGVDLPFGVAGVVAVVVVFGGWGLTWYVRYRMRRGRE